MTTERAPAEVRCNAELGPDQVESLVERLRDMSRRGYWPLLGDEAADTLEAARAVGIRQEQEIMDQQREIERLRAALAKANNQAERFERGWYLRGDALEVAVRQNERDMLMTGEELQACRAALGA